MDLYENQELETWFAKEYADQVQTKLDMGKNLIRFKNPDHIPFDLIAELCQKKSVMNISKFKNSL